MTEPDVALSDFALTLLCGWFVFDLLRHKSSLYRNLWVALFASLGAGSLTGGLVHGFFLEPSKTSEILWAASLLSIGATASSVWMLAGYTWLGRK